jgi:hypothetical protein
VKEEMMELRESLGMLGKAMVGIIMYMGKEMLEI